MNINDYPAIKAHLDIFYPQLKKRQDKGVTPYNLRNCAYMEDFSKQKIVYPDIVRMPKNKTEYNEYPHMFLDDDKYYIEATNFMMVGDYLKLILGVLTSKLGVYSYVKYYSGPIFDNKGIRYKKAYLENFPIPKLDVNNPKDVKILDEIYTIVDELHQVRKNRLNSKNIHELDSLLDSFVYQLYGLDTPEIQIIEDFFKY